VIHAAGWAAIVAGTLAQLLKVAAASVREARFAWPRFFDTGGMPSSHTAVVTALTTTIGMTTGVRSTLFSICLMFSLYFIAEAGGLRRDVGRQARVLNSLLDHLRERGALDHHRLKELVGHTWTEVGGGLLLGLAVGAGFALASRP
jgi:acid phosphatase family membrane protein YuiD